MRTASSGEQIPASGFDLEMRSSAAAMLLALGVLVGTDASAAPPAVSAGEDRSIEAPSVVVLAGSATDDGPADALTYSWSAESPDVTFTAPSSASTEARISAPGTYTLTLTVSDGAESGSNSLVITASPAVYPAPDDDTQPDRGWLRVSAADVGMDQALLDQAAAYASSAPSGAGAGMIVRHGRLVHSWGDMDLRFDLKSTTKSIGGMTLGLAMDESLLAVSDQAAAHLPSIGVPPDSNAQTGWIPQITILQLATHTAGFGKPGDYQALLFEPGTTWSYSDSGLNWLADLLTSVYARDLSNLLDERVWPILGVNADDVVWRSMSRGLRPNPRPNGLEHRELASGIIANVNAMARVGLLFLRRGVWDGQRVLPDAFVDLVQTPQPEVAAAANDNAADFPGATLDYGVLWWTNKTGQMPNVPRDAYWAWGLGDTLIVVIPSLDLVIARAGPQATVPSVGRVWNGSDWNGDDSVLAPLLDPIVESTGCRVVHSCIP